MFAGGVATMKLLEFRKRDPKVENPQAVRLVVVADGASGLESRVVPDGGEETVVVAQWRDEPPASLLLRVAARMGAIERSGRKVGQATLLVGEQRGGQTIAARRTIARALFSQLLSSGGTELVLDAVGAPVDIRHQLLTEVEGLLEEFERPSASVRLQFRPDLRPDREAPRPSGIYPVPGAVEAPRALSAR
jgi:hypothetical protein